MFRTMFRTNGRRSSVIALTVIALMLLVAPAFGAESSTVGIHPDGTNDWFHFNLVPGESSDSIALLENKTDQSQPVTIYAVDAIITPQGGFALAARDAKATGVGAWTKTGFTQIVLPPRSVTRLPVHVEVPRSAEPGDYAGGIILEQGNHDTTSANIGKGFAVQLNIVERVGVRTFIHVAGVATSKLQLGAPTWKKTSKGIEFKLPVSNTGNVRLVPSATVKISGWNVRNATLPMTAPEMLLPGSDGTLTAIWRNPPAFALGHVRFEVAATGLAPMTRTLNVNLIPIGAIAITLIILALLMLLAWRVIRFVRRARRALRLVPPAELNGIERIEIESVPEYSYYEPEWEPEPEWESQELLDENQTIDSFETWEEEPIEDPASIMSSAWTELPAPEEEDLQSSA
ncbi:MAG: hypothetical protein ACYDCC_09035 [Actinomycetota bacterium]